MNSPTPRNPAPEGQHRGAGSQAEQAHERIVAADDPGRTRRGEEHGRSQVDVGQKTQGVIDPRRHLHGPHGDKFLHRPQGADRGAERSSEKQRPRQRQREDGNHYATHRVIRIEAGLRDVLDGADRADAAVRQNPSQASETIESKNRPVRDRAFTANNEAAARAVARNARSKYSCHDGCQGRATGVGVCGIGWLLNSGVERRSAAQTACAAANTISNRASGASRFTRSPFSVRRTTPAAWLCLLASVRAPFPQPRPRGSATAARRPVRGERPA